MRKTERGLWVPFPSSDLDSPALEQNAFPVDPQMQEVLSYPALLGPNGGKLARADKNGNLLVSVQSPPAITQVQLLDPLGNFAATPNNPVIQRAAPPVLTNLIPARTDAASFTSADFNAPSFYRFTLILWVTAIAGATPGITLALQPKLSNGTYYGVGVQPAQLTGVGSASWAVSNAGSGNAGYISPVFRLVATLQAGTTSVTWGCDSIIN